MSRHFVLVGSGVAAASVATELLANDDGATVVVLEAGPPVAMGDYRSWLDYLTTRRTPYDKRGDAKSDFEAPPGSLDLIGARLFAKGGTTLHWSGWTPRFRPEDFRLHTNTGRALDWPMSYDDLEPYYTRAEHFLGVAGDSAQASPPRGSGDYPFSPPPFAQKDAPVIDALDSLGVSYAHLPIARFGDRCQTTGTCMYCPHAARYHALMSWSILEAKYPARLRVNTGVVAEEVVFSSKQIVYSSHL